MDTDPLLRVKMGAAEVIFMLGGDDEVESVENVDAELRLPNGTRWSITFLTLEEVGRLMSRWASSGECLSGAYLRIPDLIIIYRPGLPAMLEALEDVVSRGVEGVLTRIDPSDIVDELDG